jgi:hypothetical protein
MKALLGAGKSFFRKKQNKSQSLLKKGFSGFGVGKPG